MLTRIVSRLGAVRQTVIQQAQRNIGVTAAAAQKTDPIQQLFVDKVREYSQKSKSAGGKLVDATPKVELSLKEELEKIDRIFGATGKDMTQFPSFTFSDPDLGALGLGEVKEIQQAVKQSAVAEAQEEDNTPYFDY
ncbi:ATP synthase-coupling factor 6, mitochondrial-like [Haliotis rufescens]|uniref:ATP synthase-coupling factor 6, mitochondrial-like n=1 Tax=Haliotis rufescens TaxID=6454 RepID=UPI00201F702D|nr:ATP synthase-coupling factor 6, mitochondrial-like [Haliotis rufescens]